MQKEHGLSPGGGIFSTNHHLFFQDIWHNLSYIINKKTRVIFFCNTKHSFSCPHGHSGTGLIYEMVLVKKLTLEASGHECRMQFS